jgi:sugar O-acyltransferase (sialic acid O-acetyltransferase NeuD family)
MTRNSNPSTLLLFGMGGHGRVVADAALLMNAWATILASDRDPKRCQGSYLPGVDVAKFASINSLEAGIHVAIGDNTARERETFCFAGMHLKSVIHPAATMSRYSHIGAGSFVAAGAVLAPGARLGTACIINHGAVVDHDVQIGDFCHVAPMVSLGGGVILGQRVMVGAGANILPSVKIVDDVVIGAGTLVRTTIQEPGTYVGVPARRVK